jgi:hypothetical protein
MKPMPWGHDDRNGHSLGPEGPSPKVFGGAMCNNRFPKHFRVPTNIIKYDNKTNPTV